MFFSNITKRKLMFYGDYCSLILRYFTNKHISFPLFLFLFFLFQHLHTAPLNRSGQRCITASLPLILIWSLLAPENVEGVGQDANFMSSKPVMNRLASSPVPPHSLVVTRLCLLSSEESSEKQHHAFFSNWYKRRWIIILLLWHPPDGLTLFSQASWRVCFTFCSY